MSAPVRPFEVRARDLGHHSRVVIEPSFEAAALAYVEDWPHTIDDPREVSVVVRDLENGHEHCFRIDLDTGETGECA